jgi:hypothetical protein
MALSGGRTNCQGVVRAQHVDSKCTEVGYIGRRASRGFLLPLENMAKCGQRLQTVADNLRALGAPRGTIRGVASQHFRRTEGLKTRPQLQSSFAKLHDIRAKSDLHRTSVQKYLVSQSLLGIRGGLRATKYCERRSREDEQHDAP